MPIGSILSSFTGNNLPEGWVVWYCTECNYSVTFDDKSYFYAASDDVWVSSVADIIWHVHTENVFDTHISSELPKTTHRKALALELAAVDRNIKAQEVYLAELRSYRAELALQLDEAGG